MTPLPRLLIVDDDEANRVTLGALLEGEGFEVCEAASLAQARQELERGVFDAVLLDRRLGQDDGIALVPFVRATHPRAKLFVLSGADAPAAGLEGQIDGWLAKGQDVSALAARLR